MPKVTSYTVTRKLEVVRWHKENGCNVSMTSRHFGVDRKRVREWLSKELQLLQNNHGSAKNKRRINGGRKPLSEELDDDLYEIFQVEREKGRAVSNLFLAAEARKIATSLGLTDFKASDRYINNWKRRFHISMRTATNDSQKLPEDYADAMKAFRIAVRECRFQDDLTQFNIGNMDQTMVRFDHPATRTNNLAGESYVRIANTGCTKRGFTVALCGRASGHKMSAYIVFKEVSGKIPPRVLSTLRIPENVKVSASISGWMTSSSMAEWTRKVWGSDTDDTRRLLILDQAGIHKTQETTTALNNVNTKIIYVPGGCTSFAQPADVSWNKPFKDVLKAKWAEFKRLEMTTKAGNAKKPSRQDVINWISEAWKNVKEETVEASFKSCGISNALDGSEDGLLHGRLADISCAEVDEQECVDLIFASDESDEEFDGFSDSE